MPLINGFIYPGGPIIVVLVGVGSLRRRLFIKHSLPVPDPIPLRVLIDTGSSHTLFSLRVFRELGLSPVGKELLLTPSTPANEPHLCDLYDTSLSLVANGQAHAFGDRRVIGGDCWLEGEELEGLIGRDILARCNMWYLGKEKAFTLNF
ncbi:MAG: hypothetical protein U0804_17130 [Gemmataceae bacterium]